MVAAKKFIVPSDDNDQSLNAGDSQSRSVDKNTKVTNIQSEQRKTAAERIAELEFKTTQQRRLMNMAKHVAPIISSIISNPGSSAKSADKAAAINKMVFLSLNSAVKLLRESAPELTDTGWANANAFGVCAKIVADEWQRGGSCEQTESLLTGKFFSDLSATLNSADAASFRWMETSGIEPPIRNESDAATRIRLTLSKSYAPLFMDVRSFSFWKNHIGERERDEMAKTLMDKLADVAARSANEIADANGICDSDRIVFWQSMIGRAFEFAREEYRTLAQKAFGEVDAAESKADQSAVRRRWAMLDVPSLVAASSENSMKMMNGIVSRYVLESVDSNCAADPKEKAEVNRTSMRA